MFGKLYLPGKKKWQWLIIWSDLQKKSEKHGKLFPRLKVAGENCEMFRLNHHLDYFVSFYKMVAIILKQILRGHW